MKLNNTIITTMYTLKTVINFTTENCYGNRFVLMCMSYKRTQSPLVAVMAISQAFRDVERTRRPSVLKTFPSPPPTNAREVGTRSGIGHIRRAVGGKFGLHGFMPDRPDDERAAVVKKRYTRAVRSGRKITTRDDESRIYADARGVRRLSDEITCRSSVDETTAYNPGRRPRPCASVIMFAMHACYVKTS